MGNTIAATTGVVVGQGELEAIIDQDYSEQNKINKLTRNAHHQQRMDALDGNIGKLNDAKEATEKAGKFGFIAQIAGTILSAAAKLLDFVVPGLGTIVSSVLQGATQGVQQMNPYPEQKLDAELDAKAFEKDAEKANYWCQTDQENISAGRESRETVKRHLEKALENNQQAQSLAVRA